MSRQGKLAKNTMLLSIGTLFPRVANIITLPILTAYLTKEEYGTYDLITVLVTLYFPAITLQIQTAAFRFLVDERDNKEESKSIISSIYLFTIPMVFIGMMVLLLMVPGILKIKLFISLYLATDILVSTTRQISRGLNKNILYSISTVTASFGNMLLDIAFVWWLKMGLVGAVLALWLSSLFSLVINVVGLNLFEYINIKAVRWVKIKKLLCYSCPMVPNNMSMWIMRLSDRFVVTLVLGISSNAVYAVSNKIPNLLNIAQSAFTFAWQENASIVSKDEDAASYYSLMFRTIFNLMAGILCLIISVTPLLFTVLIRGDYIEAYYHIPILFLATFFYSMATFLGGIYVAYMKTKSVGITTALAAACNLAIDVVLIRHIGLFAASGSTLISYFLLLVYRMVDVKKMVKLKYDYRNIIIVFAVLIIECGLCYQRNRVFNIVSSITGIVCFILLNRAFICSISRKVGRVIHTKSKNKC